MTARRARRGLRLPPATMRLGMRQAGRRCLDPALPWQVQRTRLDQVTRISLLPRRTTVTEQTIAGLRAEVVSSGAPGSRLTVVHFHGGGYCLGSARMARSWAAHLSAQTGCRVVLPEYRLAPEHPHPAALQDARAVIAALSGEADAGPVVMSGDSAGGGLALALILAMRDEGQEPPAGCILLSPWLGFFVGPRTKLEDGQLGTVPGRLDDPVSGDAEALVDVFLPVPVVEPGPG
jgi:acetyl esterase/lipase